ncbi:MAG: glutamine synthetase [Deltaproteobacteria bacterium]|nr:glutamine synthetase [Deltaproteobacteria bacterium]MCB9786393.1 glutamine synthetase [Deltaproteobacteria bacterium]
MSRIQHPAAEHILHDLEGAGVRRVRLGGFDIDGVLRGKYITLDKLRSVLNGGMGFCDVIFGWDSQDELYEGTGVTLTGWHTGYPDLQATVDPTSLRRVPWEGDIPFFLLDFALPDGSPYPASPRQVLQQVVGHAARQGFIAHLATEYEFFVFAETPDSVRDKGYRTLQHVDPGMFGYSALRASAAQPIIQDLTEHLDAFGIPVEGIHTETGPGIYEAAIAHDESLIAADNAALFKTAAKEILGRHGLMPSFMAKPFAHLPGCSGHTHQSLWRDGQPAFHDADDPMGMSPLFRSYVAGLQRMLPELMAIFCPTINSYKRTVPGMWAPTTATWGFENRTASLRIIRSASGKGTRVENRLIGSDVNPYLAGAASLAAGLWGVEQGLELGAPVEGNAYAAGADAAGAPLPRSLAEAADRLDRSELARELLGDAFVSHYVATRRWEVQQFAKAVTDWELARYLEII